MGRRKPPTEPVPPPIQRLLACYIAPGKTVEQIKDQVSDDLSHTSMDKDRLIFMQSRDYGAYLVYTYIQYYDDAAGAAFHGVVL